MGHIASMAILPAGALISINPLLNEPNIECSSLTKQKYSVPIILFLFVGNAQHQYVTFTGTFKSRFWQRIQLTLTIVYSKLDNTFTLIEKFLTK